jgi:hypothetical protein
MLSVLKRSSSFSGHEVRPINDLFRPYDCICLVVSLIAVQVVFFRQVASQGIVTDILCLPSS